MSEVMPPELAAAVVAAQLELTNVKKDKRAEAGKYGYTYADLGAVLEVVRPVLARHGVAVLQPIRTGEGHVEVETLLVHTTGAAYSAGVITANAPESWQAFGSAVTYARRYALMAALALAGEDDDGAAASPNGTAPDSSSTPTRGLRGPAARNLTGPATDAQIGKVAALMRQQRIPEHVLNDFAVERLGFELPVEGLAKLTKGQASALIEALTGKTGPGYVPQPGRDYTPEGAIDGTVTRSTTADPDDPWQTGGVEA